MDAPDQPMLYHEDFSSYSSNLHQGPYTVQFLLSFMAIGSVCCHEQFGRK